MNIKRVQRKNRKAISPVLATVILIAITLIAAIAIAGFVFGQFGTLTTTAQISASVASCANSNSTCQILLTNTGNAAGTANSCSYTGTGGGGGALTQYGAQGLSVAAGKAIEIHCKAPSTLSPTIGAGVSGAVQLSNGGSALFSGVWQ